MVDAPGRRRTASVDDVLWALGRVAIYSGIAGWVVSTVAILAATAMAPWFSWTGNALSDLGAPARASAPLFNNGLILAGILGVVFVVRTAAIAENLAHWAAVAVMAGATADLSLIGAFPTGHPLHYTVSVIFFVSLSFGLFFFGTGDVLAGRRLVGLWAFWLGVIHVTGWVVWTTGLGTGGVAIPEFVGSLALLGWVIPLTVRLRGESLALFAEYV